MAIAVGVSVEPFAIVTYPANPVAGQMWYRSDAGVTAHFDSIQNRVVYSSEINDGNVNVTSKGIVNGLSVLPNDGTGGFGPDTTLGATSVGQIGSPYTQTVGIQESLNYAGSVARLASGGYILPEVRLLDGKFILNTDVTIPTFSSPSGVNSIPSFSIIGNGYGFFEGGTYINGNGYNLIIGTTAGEQTTSGGFLIQGLNLQYFGIHVRGNYNANPNIIFRDIGMGSGYIDMNNAYNIAQLNLDNVFQLNGDPSYIAGAYQVSATNLTFKSGLILGNPSNTASGGATGVNQVGVVNLAEGIGINYGNTSADFTEWELDNNITEGIGNNGITNNLPSGVTATLNINVGTMIINTTEKFFVQTSGAGTLNVKLHINHLTFQTAVNDWTVPAGINIEELTIDEITNLTSTATSSANLPIMSSTSGTTAGTVATRFNEYASSHKKIYITFTGYENDTTTDQTINFPMKFNSDAIVIANNTGLTISATTSGITITSPDSTTPYSGIVIIEGY